MINATATKPPTPSRRTITPLFTLPTNICPTPGIIMVKITAMTVPYKKNYPSIYDLQFLQQNMFIIPVPFSKEHKAMLAHCKELIDYQNGYMAIHARYIKLITAPRTAVENVEGSLDKDATSHDDCLDAFRLSLQFWH